MQFLWLPSKNVLLDQVLALNCLTLDMWVTFRMHAKCPLTELTKLGSCQIGLVKFLIWNFTTICSLFLGLSRVQRDIQTWQCYQAYFGNFLMWTFKMMIISSVPEVTNVFCKSLTMPLKKIPPQVLKTLYLRNSKHTHIDKMPDSCHPTV